MSDIDAPGGGPGSTDQAAAPAAPPAVLVPTPRTMFQGGGIRMPQPEDALVTRYSLRASTPLPHLAAMLVLVGAAWWAVDWARWTPESPEPRATSEWWTNVLLVTAPGEDLGFAAWSDQRMWIALSLVAAAWIAFAVLVGRIGTNVRPGGGPFGSLLPLVAFPAWWILPISINVTAEAARGRYDLLIRFLVALGLLVTQFLILRWPTTDRIWRAGRLPYDAASIVLWLPVLIPWMMIIASNLTTVFLVDEGEPASESPWFPTEAMYDWARWTGRATSAGLLVLLVVVAIAQHVGIGKDRADVDATRGADRT